MATTEKQNSTAAIKQNQQQSTKKRTFIGSSFGLAKRIFGKRKPETSLNVNSGNKNVAPPVPLISKEVRAFGIKTELLELLNDIQSYGALYKEGIDYLDNSLTEINFDLDIQISESDQKALITISDALNDGATYDKDSHEFRDVIAIIHTVLNSIDEQLAHVGLNVNSDNKKVAPPVPQKSPEAKEIDRQRLNEKVQNTLLQENYVTPNASNKKTTPSVPTRPKALLHGESQVVNKATKPAVPEKSEKVRQAAKKIADARSKFIQDMPHEEDSQATPDRQFEHNGEQPSIYKSKDLTINHINSDIAASPATRGNGRKGVDKPDASCKQESASEFSKVNVKGLIDKFEKAKK